MIVSIILFLVFIFLTVVGGPWLASTGGADYLQISANIIIFASPVLALIVGIRSSVKSNMSKPVKGLLIFLVVAAVIAAFIGAALQM
ncbi:hypothetical protein HOI18_01075 [Candidatus Uhrbacteria bacterium]|jgi:hypothetical protein|nr:hypothetical protein [Candidatus Uhrbacteria bacterium]